MALLGERLRRAQVLGAGVAAAGLAVIGAGLRSPSSPPEAGRRSRRGAGCR